MPQLTRRAFLSASGLAAQRPAQKPNIILFVSDDHQADALSFLGHKHVRTPHLNSVFSQGVFFKNAYVFGANQTSVCAPARTQLHSGRNLYHWAQRQAASKNPNEYCLAQAFRAAGYITARSGKAVNVPAPLCEEFHSNVMNSRIPVNVHVDNAVAFLNEHAGKQPFFLAVEPRIPHAPYPTIDKHLTHYLKRNIELPANFAERHPIQGIAGIDETSGVDERRALEDRARYYASIAYMDEEFGRLLAALNKSGQRENTILVFAGDNGYSLGEHGLTGKANLYEKGGMHIPLTFAGPGIAKGMTAAFAYMMDIFPTLCDLAGVAIPSQLDGRSLRPVLVNPKKQSRETLHTAYLDSQRAIRDQRWKLLRFPKLDKTLLFDLESDPHEMRDLAGDPAQASRIQKMRAQLATACKQAGDPHAS